jgi:signal peptidase II
LTHRRSRDLVVLGAAIIILAADQISKHLVRTSLIPGVPYDPVPWLSPVLSFTYITNTGVSFGLFPQLGSLGALVNIAVITVLLFSYRRLPVDNWLIHLSLGMQVGGALGNLVDRLLWRGQVTDFIDLNFWPLHEWPVFNLADSSVVVGVVILAYFLLFDLEIEAEPNEQA